MHVLLHISSERRLSDAWLQDFVHPLLGTCNLEPKPAPMSEIQRAARSPISHGLPAVAAALRAMGWRHALARWPPGGSEVCVPAVTPSAYLSTPTFTQALHAYLHECAKLHRYIPSFGAKPASLLRRFEFGAGQDVNLHAMTRLFKNTSAYSWHAAFVHNCGPPVKASKTMISKGTSLAGS